MAFEKPLLIQTFTAASALTNSTNQYTLVKLLTNGHVVPCALGADLPIGVLQNLPDQGEQAEVLMLGVSKVRVGGTDIAGVSAAFIATDANGKAALAVATANSQTYAIGRVLKIDASDNDGALVTAAINTISLMYLRLF